VIPERARAWEILCEHNQSEALRRHALAVEGVMRHFSGLLDGNTELWGVIGLLHDLDYERHPDQHCAKTAEILAGFGVDESLIRACVSHGYGVCNDVEPLTDAEKALFTIDELTGLIGATALMRPSRSVMDLELKSVMKKYKTATFAAGCDRALIERGCAMMEMPLEDVITQTILGMRDVHEAIGL